MNYDKSGDELDGLLHWNGKISDSDIRWSDNAINIRDHVRNVPK